MGDSNYIPVNHKNIECSKCSEQFKPRSVRQKYCSERCRRGAYTIGGMGGFITNVPSGTVGTIAELVVATDLMRKGWNVFRAMSPSCFCDLVAHKPGGEVKFIEVRTGYRNQRGDVIQPFKLGKSKEVSGVKIDYAVYIHATDEIFYMET